MKDKFRIVDDAGVDLETGKATERISELEDLMVEMTEEAISVMLDYQQSGSNMDSGSIVAIHQNSPLLDNEKESLGDIAVNIQRKEK